MTRTLKVAVIQFSAGADKAKNMRRVLRLVTQAAKAKAKFVLLPEVFNCRRAIMDAVDLHEIAEPINGLSIRPLIDLSRKYRIYILAGSLLEKTKRKKAFNTSALISPSGKIVARYRKQNLFDARLPGKTLRESRFLLPGRKNVVTDVFGFKVGLAICYDLRFVKIFDRYRKVGVDIICIPSAFTHKTGKAHWHILTRSRAIENQCFVLAPNQAGVDGRGVRTYGHSLIVDPWGHIMKQADTQKEKILYTTISRDQIERAAQILPLLRV